MFVVVCSKRFIQKRKEKENPKNNTIGEAKKLLTLCV